MSDMTDDIKTIVKEIRRDGGVAFLILSLVTFLGFITYRAEVRLDKQTAMLAEERAQVTVILKDIAKSHEMIAEAQKDLSNLYKSRDVRLERLEVMMFYNYENIRAIQRKLSVEPVEYGVDMFRSSESKEEIKNTLVKKNKTEETQKN